MKVQSRLLFLAAALMVTSATAAWANITTDYDHKVDFARIKTYSWGNVKTPDSLWDERVKQAVDGQLAAAPVPAESVPPEYRCNLSSQLQRRIQEASAAQGNEWASTVIAGKSLGQSISLQNSRRTTRAWVRLAESNYLLSE